ncbi:unnamed protein product [Diamesa serratosioi]
MNLNYFFSDNDFPETKTQYYYKTHQSATVSIPGQHRGRIPVGPDENETEAYVTKVDTTVLSARKHNKRFKDEDDDDTRSHLKPFFRTGKFCIKCPPEKILIAKRGLDGVLVETPQLTTCNDKPISRSLYDMETLFSQKHHFILPRGSHSFIGQIVNKKNYSIEHVCHLKFKIIVRSCGSYIPKNENVKVKCDMGDIWGSKCTFHCRNNGILTHREPVFCNDNLQWSGAHEPECIVQHKTYFHNIEAAITACQLPPAPDHAKFSCKVSRGQINELSKNLPDNELFIPDFTVCRVKCARYYEIPEHLQKFATFTCHKGKWNYTSQNNFCTKIQVKRFN